YAGVAVEELAGPWLVAASGLVTVRADRKVTGMVASLPPRFAASLTGAHVWKSGVVLSTGASWAIEGDASLDGKRVPSTDRRALQLALALQAPLGDGVRLVASAFTTPPVPVVSAGEAASSGLSAALVVPLL